LFLSLALGVMMLKISGFTVAFLPALGPLLFFYTRKLIASDQQFRRKDLLHFCPILAGYWMPTWLALFGVIIYLYLSHRLIQHFYDRLRPVLMDRPRFAFRQLERILLVLGLLCLLWLFNELFSFAVAFVLIGMATEVMLKPDNSELLPTPVTDTWDAKEKGRRLKEAVAARRLYEDADLTLATLAVELGLHPHDLSKILNQGLKKNFSDFINEFRVREVARKMKDPAYDKLTLLGIAYESGFNSQSTFHRVFKELTGKTPADYKKELSTYKLGAGSRHAAIILNQETTHKWSDKKSNGNYMFRNYFKIAWRNLIRNKISSSINIGGLAVGMAVAMLIGLWIWDELSANRHFENYGSLYQVITHQSNQGEISTGWVTPLPMGDELKSKFGDIKAVAMCDGRGRHTLENGDKKIAKDGFFIGEEAVSMFSFDILYGDKNPLHDPYSIVLTDETARALFNTTDAVGKTVKLDNSYELTVKAVISKQPGSSSLIFDCLIPWKLLQKIYSDSKLDQNDWGNNSWRTFVQLNDKASVESVNQKIKNVVLDHFPGDRIVQTAKPQIELFPMSKWKLYTDFENGKNIGGYIKYIRLFGILAIVVLLNACINFMNLSTARSSRRAKEIGIRKVVGSLRQQLIIQFFLESLCVTILALAVAMLIVFFALPYFNTLTGKEMSLLISSPAFWLLVITFTLLTGLTAGSYPALFLSAFNPLTVLKGKMNRYNGSELARKVLVVIQFTSSIVLMIGTIVVYQQIQHGKDRPVGYDKNGLISVNYSQEMAKSFSPLQNDLVAGRGVYSVCLSNSAATEICCSQNGWEWQGSKPTDKAGGINTIATSFNFTKTFGIQMVAGRDFSADYPTDSAAVLLNEAAVKFMRFKDPIGQTIKWNGQNRTVIGVVPDLQMESPFQSVSPLIIKFSKDWVNSLIVRVNPDISMSKALNNIKAVLERYNVPFEYQFADKAYAKKFYYEESVAGLSVIITVIAIFISCLGLFGLASYKAEQRTKEIGVRRVLGASVSSIWQLLSKDFIMLVLLACAVAIPISLYLMHDWLKTYQYKIDISWGMLLLVVLASLVITLMTVSFQAIKAAITNPVKSLRSE